MYVYKILYVIYRISGEVEKHMYVIAASKLKAKFMLNDIWRKIYRIGTRGRIDAIIKHGW